MYSTNEIFRLREGDLYDHVQWTYDINRRIAARNNGSSYFTEFGWNANGNLIYNYGTYLNNTNTLDFTCAQPVVTDWDEPTQLEYIKPLGTGEDKWPTEPSFSPSRSGRPLRSSRLSVNLACRRRVGRRDIGRM